VCTGRVLDVGCGIGRCLDYLGRRATGIDPNVAAVEIARRRGHDALAPDEAQGRHDLHDVDTLLCSHVVEHMGRDDAVELLCTWLPRLRPGGRVVVIVPQARGFASDPTHVRPIGRAELVDLARATGVDVERVRSFPLPRSFGRAWVHNETVLIGHRP